MNRTVAIVGSSQSTREDAPFDDPNIDIWVFNEAASQIAELQDGTKGKWVDRCDGVFQLHRPEIYRSVHNRSDPDHWKWLKQEHDFPIWMMEVDAKVPACVRFPIEDVKELLNDFVVGPDKKPYKYFTSTVVYAVSLAILKGYEEILVYGVEMISDTEYTYQRDCVTFWTGYALGRGIKIHFYSGSDIWNKPLYAYEGKVEHKATDFVKRIKLLEKQSQKARKVRNQAEENLVKSYTNGNLSECITKICAAAAALGEVDGSLFEAKRYHHKLSDGMPYIDRNELEGTAAKAGPLIEQHVQEVHRTAGRIDYIMQVWEQSKHPAAEQNLKTFIGQHMKAGYDSGYMRGVYKENHRLAQEWDKTIKQAGGEKALAAVHNAG